MPRGGKRSGAGRPMSDRSVPVTVRLSQRSAEFLKSQSNQSEFVEKLIMAAQNAIYVDCNQISPSNFQCGDVLGGSGGNQYVIVDVSEQIDCDEKYAVLNKLPDDEKIKPEFLDGQVEF